MYPIFFVFIQILTMVSAVLNGVVCLFNPILAIKIQQKFYERINWKIEPVNLKKELRNTRIMGLISLILAALITINIVIKF